MHDRYTLLTRFFLIAAFLTGSLLADEYRTLNSSDGKSIVAKVTGYDSESGVSIETRSGQKYKDVAVGRFSAEDQQYFKEWSAKRAAEKNDARLMSDARIKMFVKSSRDNDLNEKGDPDNREVEYEPAITFDNEDKDLTYKDIEGTLVFIGQSVLDKSEFHILYRQNFTVTLPANERIKWVGRHFKNVYDDYAANGSAFGAEYEGYLLVLRDKEGRPVIVKTSKSKWGACIPAIMSADQNKGHSRDFSKSFQKTVY